VNPYQSKLRLSRLGGAHLETFTLRRHPAGAVVAHDFSGGHTITGRADTFFEARQRAAVAEKCDPVLIRLDPSVLP
jgi:hypothetical protein